MSSVNETDSAYSYFTSCPIKYVGVTADGSLDTANFRGRAQNSSFWKYHGIVNLEATGNDVISCMEDGCKDPSFAFS